MLDLKDLLKAVVKEKPERKEALLAIVEEDVKWSYSDKNDYVVTVLMTKYELHWLMWRIRVHLRSYNAMEWSEMKDVLTTILKRLEGEWAQCQFTGAPSAKESSPNGMPTLVDSALTSPGL